MPVYPEHSKSVFNLKNFILVVQARSAEKVAASKNKISYQNKDFNK